MKCELAGLQGPFVGAWQVAQGGATGKLTTWSAFLFFLLVSSFFSTVCFVLLCREGGHRVFAVAHWQGKIKPGVSSALASSLDLLPTIAKLAGAQLRTDVSYDGLDLSDVLFNGAANAHETLFHPQYPNGNITAVRYRQYKVLLFVCVSVCVCLDCLFLCLCLIAVRCCAGLLSNRERCAVS